MGAIESITLTNFELTRLFLALLSLFFSAHLFGYLFGKVNLPRVIGEIFGGLILGPTLLGNLSLSTQDSIFNAFQGEGKVISAFSWFGLILLMFISGFEVEKSFSKEDRRIATTFLLGATVAPYFIGSLVPYLYDLSRYAGPTGSTVTLSIIIGIAVAVTSIPVISKIFLDLGIAGTRFAKIVLTIATVEDVILYAALAVATGIVGIRAVSANSLSGALAVIAIFFILSLLGLPRLIQATDRSRFNFLIRDRPPVYALFLCLFLVVVASLLNVNIVFGAFLAGYAVGSFPGIFQKAKSHIKSVGLSMFTPLYFAVVGLKLDLIHNFDPFFFLAFLGFSSGLKTICTLIVGKLANKDWLTSLNFSVALNARGGPGIVLATVAFDVGIINGVFFTTLVLVAIITSLIAGYWLRYVLTEGLHLTMPSPDSSEKAR